MSTTAITVTKTEAIARLTAQLKVAERFDRERIAQHKKDEQSALIEFRAALRAAMKWDYATAKQHYFQIDTSIRRNAPECPRLMARWIGEELKRVQISQQETYKASPDSSLHQALLWDPTPVEDPCA